jgi:predicted PurR-regulated permease PerM
MQIRSYLLDYKNRVLILYTILLLLIFYFTRNILLPIIFSVGLTYLTYPLYKRYLKITKRKALASFLVVTQTVLVFLLPLFYVIFQIIYNFLNMYRFYLQNNTELINLKLKLLNLLYKIIPYEEARGRIIESFVNATDHLFSYLSQTFISFTSSIPILIVYLVILVVSQYYLLIHGEKILKFITEFMPFGNYNEIIIEDLKKSVDNLIYGLVLPAFVQSISLIFILIILGVNIDYFLIFLLGFIFAFIPSLGIWIVWLPLSLKLLDSTVKLIIYFIYNLIITSNVDFLTRVLVSIEVGEVPVWVVIFSTFGGLLTFGFGGMLVALFLSIFAYNLYKDLFTKSQK